SRRGRSLPAPCRARSRSRMAAGLRARRLLPLRLKGEEIAMAYPATSEGSVERSDAAPFAAVQPTAGGHFVLCLYAAIFHLLNHARRLSEVTGAPFESTFEKYPFLGEYFAEMREAMPDDITWGD